MESSSGPVKARTLLFTSAADEHMNALRKCLRPTLFSVAPFPGIPRLLTMLDPRSYPAAAVEATSSSQCP